MKRISAILLVLTAIVSCSSPAEKKIGIVAHRGLWKCEEAGFAENSIASLRCAQDAGFWGSEFDVQMTSDEVLLVHHDDAVNGVNIHTNPASAFSEARLKNGEAIPTFDEYLTQGEKCPTTVLVLEIKANDTPEAEIRETDLCVEKLKEHGLFSPDRVIFISFSEVVCKHIAEIAPEFTNQYLSDSPRPAEMADFGINGMDTYYGTVQKDSSWYAESRENGMSFNVWTVDDAETIKEFALLGVDQITTNIPLVARTALEEAGVTEAVLK